MTWDDSLKRYNSKYVLLGGFNHLEKCEFVNGKDDNPYMKWKKNVPNHQPGLLSWDVELLE